MFARLGVPVTVLEAMPRRILIIIQIPFRPGAIRPGVETVNEHARDGGRTGNLNPRLLQFVRHRRDVPLSSSDLGAWGVGREHAVMQRALKHCGSLLAKELGLLSEALMQEDQIVYKLGGKKLFSPFDRSKTHPGRRRHYRAPSGHGATRGISCHGALSFSSSSSLS